MIKRGNATSTCYLRVKVAKLPPSNVPPPEPDTVREFLYEIAKVAGTDFVEIALPRGWEDRQLQLAVGHMAEAIKYRLDGLPWMAEEHEEASEMSIVKYEDKFRRAAQRA